MTASLLFVIPFIVYLLTSFRFLWTADAGDLAVSFAANQLSHAPGYPLYLLIGGLINSVIHNPVWSLSLISVIAAVLTLFFLYKTIQLVLKKYTHQSSSTVITVALLSVAFTPLWWLSAIVQEVFMLTMLFIVILNLFMMLFVTQKLLSPKLWYMFLVVFSLSIFHQYVVLLLTPLIVMSLWPHRRQLMRREFISGLPLLFTGVLPYIIFITQKTQSNIFLWRDPSSLSDTWQALIRADYGTINLFGQLWTAPVAVRFAAIFEWGRVMVRSLSVVLVVFALLGVYAFIKNKLWRIALLFIGEVFIVGPLLFFAYPLIPRNFLGNAIFERFVALSLPAIAVVIAVGIYSLFGTLQKTLKKTPYFAVIFSLIMLTIPSAFAIKYARYFYQRAHNNALERLAQTTVDFLPSNSIFIAKGDFLLFPLTYISFIEHYRRDVIVIPSRFIENPYLRALNTSFFLDKELVAPSHKQKNPLKWFIQNNGSYSIFTNFALIDMPLLKQVGPVYAYRYTVHSDTTPKGKIFLEQNRPFLVSIKKSFPLYDVLQVNQQLEKTALFFAEEKVKEKNYKAAEYFIERVYELSGKSDALYSLGVLYYKQRKCDKAAEVWEEAFLQSGKPDIAYRLTQLYAVCFRDTKKTDMWYVIYQAARDQHKK